MAELAVPLAVGAFTAAASAAAAKASANARNSSIEEAATNAEATNKYQAKLSGRTQTETLARRVTSVQKSIRGNSVGRTGQSTRSFEIGAIAQGLDEQTNVGRNVSASLASITQNAASMIAGNYQSPNAAAFQSGLTGLNLGVGLGVSGTNQATKAGLIS